MPSKRRSHFYSVVLAKTKQQGRPGTEQLPNKLLHPLHQVILPGEGEERDEFKKQEYVFFFLETRVSVLLLSLLAREEQTERTSLQ